LNRLDLMTLNCRVELQLHGQVVVIVDLNLTLKEMSLRNIQEPKTYFCSQAKEIPCPAFVGSDPMLKKSLPFCILEES
jgi:hypothetical protein